MIPIKRDNFKWTRNNQNYTAKNRGKAMREYLIKRIGIALLTLYIVITINFLIFQVLTPRNPAQMIIDPGFKPEVRRELERQFGVYDAVQVKYAKYLSSMLTWNFGWSFTNRKPVNTEMIWRLRNTILLLGTALVGVIIVGIPIGILASSKRGSPIDVLAIGSGLFTWAIPIFFIELLFLLVFALYFKLWFGWGFPPSGVLTNPPPTEPLAFIKDLTWHMALPVSALIIGGFGGWALYTRNLMLDALTQDYIVTARAKGLGERAVLYRHAFRSTLPPIVTMITLAVPGIVTGAMITEYIFTWPGIGHWYLDAMQANDYPVVQAVLYVYSILVIAANFIADILYGILDPRIRVGMRR